MLDATQRPEAPPSPDMEFPYHLDNIDSILERLRAISGTVGLSVGVYKEGKEPYYANIGYRDVRAGIPVDEHTIFPAASLTKLFISMALARAVDDGKISWDSRVTDLLPEFSIGNDTLRNSITVADILSHRSGMSRSNFFRGSDNVVLIGPNDGMDFINDQVPVSPVGEKFLYNNIGYEIAGRILDKIYGSWTKTVREGLFEPLGMERSFTGKPPTGTDNVSKAYNILDDRSSLEIPTVESGEGVFGSASDGMFTCVADLLKAYEAFIKAMDAEDPGNTGPSSDGDTAMGESSGSESPIRLVKDICAPRIRVAPSTKDETEYAFGLMRAHLPNPMGHLSLNHNLLARQNIEMPTVGAGTNGNIVLYHQGHLAGASSAMAIIPKAKTAVVIMSNSLGLNNCPSWVLQLLLDDILGATVWNDYEYYAQKSAEFSLKWFWKLNCNLDKTRNINTQAKSKSAFTGTYWNEERYLCIEVSISNGNLHWALQGREREKFEMHHFQNVTYTWLHPRNRFVSRGRLFDRPESFFKLHFSNEKRGRYLDLRWQHDEEVPGGEMFYRDEGRD